MSTPTIKPQMLLKVKSIKIRDFMIFIDLNIKNKPAAYNNRFIFQRLLHTTLVDIQEIILENFIIERVGRTASVSAPIFYHCI